MLFWSHRSWKIMSITTIHGQTISTSARPHYWYNFIKFLHMNTCIRLAKPGLSQIPLLIQVWNSELGWSISMGSKLSSRSGTQCAPPLFFISFLLVLNLYALPRSIYRPARSRSDRSRGAITAARPAHSLSTTSPGTPLSYSLRTDEAEALLLTHF